LCWQIATHLINNQKKVSFCNKTVRLFLFGADKFFMSAFMKTGAGSKKNEKRLMAKCQTCLKGFHVIALVLYFRSFRISLSGTKLKLIDR
jgi:hypothetical protein